MKRTALRLLHFWKFSQGWLQLADDHPVIIKSIGSCTIMSCHYIYLFYLYAKACGLTPTIICFSWHNPGSVWCPDVVDVFSGNPETCPEGKLRTIFLWPVYSLAKLGSPNFQAQLGWRGWGIFENVLFGLTPSVTKELFPDLLENLKAHKSWGDFIKLANINTSLLKTSGSSLSQSGWVYTFFLRSSFWPKQFRARSLKGILFLKWAVCKIVDLLTSHWQTLSGLI